MAVSCKSEKAQLANCSISQDDWPVDCAIGNSDKDNCQTYHKPWWILAELNACLSKGPKNVNDVCSNIVVNVVSSHWTLNITTHTIKYSCWNGFLKRCYPHLTAWIVDGPEHVSTTWDLQGWCPMCENAKDVLIVHSTFWPFNNPCDWNDYLKLLDSTNIDSLPTLCVHPIHNIFWQHPLCNDYWLWQPDEQYHPHMRFVKD